MAMKPNPGHSRGSVSSRTKAYSGSVGALPKGDPCIGGVGKARASTNTKENEGIVCKEGKKC